MGSLTPVQRGCDSFEQRRGQRVGRRMKKGFPVAPTGSALSKMQVEFDRVESDIPSQRDEVCLVEVKHRLQLGTLGALEFRHDLVSESGYGRDIPAPEQVVWFREHASVDGLENRKATSGSQDAKELSKGVALSAHVDQDGTRCDDVYASIDDANQTLGTRLHEPTAVRHPHRGRAFRASLQQLGETSLNRTRPAGPQVSTAPNPTSPSPHPTSRRMSPG